MEQTWTFHCHGATMAVSPWQSWVPRFRKGEFHGQGALVLASRVHHEIVRLSDGPGFLEISNFKKNKQQNSLLVVLCCFVPQIVLHGLCSVADVAVMRSTQMGAATRPRPSLRMLRCACPIFLKLDDS